ncbi:hypothetical protein B0A48_17393 [Cryoendolithus antarcticus]|uniref:tRNA-dihydrouridine(47) synthase [NAD(P)(+)] n=1 Tax=Cryoendolithus antarcticus TaxID=1507870 RepID=A0A1V8SCL9_9PEZI|nr:hypothetical protein B0A48_17393 [Cryoendolithus antarcticus]
MDDSITNPVDASAELKAATAESMPEANPQTQIFNEDSSTTKAEKVVRGQAINGNESDARDNDSEAPPSKRLKLDDRDAPAANGSKERIKGIAPIKQEYLIDLSSASHQDHDDDAAEALGKRDERGVAGRGARGGKGGKKQSSGQNHSRQFGSSRDAISLCKSRDHQNEFDPSACQYGEKCKFEHDIRKYLKDGKREDLATLDGKCPVWDATEIELEDGRKELKLRNGKRSSAAANADGDTEEQSVGVVNMVSIGHRIELRKKKFQTSKADAYLAWLNDADGNEAKQKKASTDDMTENGDSLDNRARYKEPPLRPSEKRRIYYGPETPILAPLTTQGNMPFRRLCVSLGAQLTWSEMAMSLPLLQGEKGEWALLKAHESETRPPKYTPKSIMADYDNSKDFIFGAQIAGNKPWLTLKTTEAITELCPFIRAIDLNCGCPIDLVYQQGAGSALLDAPAKLEKILRGMNTVSKDVPITVKIRMGTKDRSPTALKLCQRFVLGGPEAQEFGQGPAGVAAITLHGRSRQQRYTRTADWEYIAECAALVSKLKESSNEAADTTHEIDARDLSSSTKSNGLPYFIGNGDILTHEDYYNAVSHGGVDSAMVARGALIKPWIFEEIATEQYIDKSATERLAYIEQFARNGLEYWGSDEIGVGITRRFLLEWLSFSCRYVPIGLLEHLPPRIGDRPPAFHGRSELETLLSSGNYKDWIKISEMFLGTAHPDFNFQPKHKSNSYEIEAEGELQAASKAKFTTSGTHTGVNDIASLAHTIVSDPAFDDVVETRYFQFFRLRTVVSTNSLVDARFWSKTVLQFYHIEPAVRHAVLALSSTHQIREACSESNTELALSHQHYADTQYRRGLRSLHDLISRSSDSDTERILVACTLFICFENLWGNYEASRVHAEAGRRLLSQHSQQDDRRKRHSEIKELQQLFRRLDVAADSLSDTNTAYPLGDERVFCAFPLSADPFNSLDDARSSLVDLIRGCQFIACDTVFEASIDKSQRRERAHLLERLAAWSSCFETTLTTVSRPQTILVLTLRLWYLLSKAVMVVGWKGPERRWDEVVHLFEELVNHGEDLLLEMTKSSLAGDFSFDLGYIVPLFFTVERCRDPTVRRRALAVLKARPRQEGVWESSGAARVVEKWMLIEESGLDVKVAADIPDWHRLQYVDAVLETDKARARIVYKLEHHRIAGEALRSRSMLINSENQRERDCSEAQWTIVPGKLRLMSMNGNHKIEHRVAIAESKSDVNLGSPEAIHALFDD